jgi:hypothetical protein
MAAIPASTEKLLRDGIDCSPIPTNYDPLSVECEVSAAGENKDDKQECFL